MTPDEIVALAQALAEITNITLTFNVTILADTGLVVEPMPIPAPAPAPVEPPTIYVTVKSNVAKANARCVNYYNTAGYPVMQIYPNDKSEIRDRVQFLAGERIAVNPDMIRADGGDMYWSLAHSEAYAEVPLYLRAEDVL